MYDTCNFSHIVQRCRPISYFAVYFARPQLVNVVVMRAWLDKPRHQEPALHIYNQCLTLHGINLYLKLAHITRSVQIYRLEFFLNLYLTHAQLGAK